MTTGFSQSRSGSSLQLAILILILISATRGSSFIFIKLGIEQMSVTALVFLRVAIASAFLFTVLKLSGRSTRVGRRDMAFLVLIAVLGNVIPFYLIGFAEQKLDSSITSVVVTLVPVFVLILAHFFTDDERITVMKVIGVLISFCGILTIFLQKIYFEGGSAIYLLSALLSALFYAMSALVAKRISDTKPEVTSAFVLMIATLVMLPFFVADISVNPLDISLLTVGTVMGLAILATAIPFVLMYKLIAEQGASFFSLNNFLIPIIALFLGVTLLGETLSVLEITGSLAVLLGLTFSVRPKGGFLPKPAK